MRKFIAGLVIGMFVAYKLMMRNKMVRAYYVTKITNRFNRWLYNTPTQSTEPEI